MKALLLTLGTIILTMGVLANAYYQKRQFYPSVVYLTKSSPSMAVLYLQAFVVVIILGKFMRKIFFGHLRAAEMEHLIERSWYAVTETCLAFTVFRDDFSPRFVALFTILLFLKCFHWLAEDRIDYMERSPVISVLFHIRAISLMALLSVLDSYFISHAYHNTLIKGPSVQLVFGFEYAVLLTAVVHVFIKYFLHAVDLQSDNPWENKAVYLLYTEVVLGGLKVGFYLLFLAIMVKVHTFPLFIIRPMYLTVREFKKALNDVVMSRRAIRNMNTLYPDATNEELSAGDNVCIICREEMHSLCKKLPCNHIFHTSCLRSWFQRQQTCPTCRMDVLHIPVITNSNQAQLVQQPLVAPNYRLPQTLVPVIPAVTSSNSVEQTVPVQFSGYIPYNWPFLLPPVPPSGFSELSSDEVRQMAGSENNNVEERLQYLWDIQTLLYAALLHMNHYIIITAGDNNSDHNQADTDSGSVHTASDDATVKTTALNIVTGLNSSNLDGAATSDESSIIAENSAEEDGKVNEIRKRRLEHFSSSNLHEQDKTE